MQNHHQSSELIRRQSGEQTQLGIAIIAVAIVFSVTSTVSVGLRFYAKKLRNLSLCAEDWVIIAAQIAVYCMAAVNFCLVFLAGAGVHQDNATPEEITNFGKILIAAQIFFALSMGLVKISICLFLIRIFSVRNFKIAAYIVLSIVVAWTVMIILTAFLLCQPLEANWDHTVGHCGDQISTFQAIGALDLIVDAMVFCLPLTTIWNLRIARKAKVALFGIFGLGVFTMAISGLRLQSLLNVTPTDFTYTASVTTLWTFLEPALGVTVACGPLMRPLLGRSKTYNSSNRTPEGSQSFRKFGAPAGHGSALKSFYSAQAGRTPGTVVSPHESQIELKEGITVVKEWKLETRPGTSSNPAGQASSSKGSLN